MKTLVRSTLALGLLALLVPPALAQGPGGMMGRGNRMGLLMNEGVQKELKLTEAQIEKARDAAEGLREKFAADLQGFRQLPDEERRRVIERMAEESRKLTAEILEADQTKRFDQIVIQAQGVDAFATKEVQEALKLTDDQRQKLGEISREVGQQAREAFQSAQGDFQGAMTRVSSLRKEAMAKASAMLTDEQKKAWTDLIGAPFEVQFQPRRPRATN